MSEQTASLDGRVDDVTIDWQRLVNDRPVGPSGSSVLTEDDTQLSTCRLIATPAPLMSDS